MDATKLLLAGIKELEYTFTMGTLEPAIYWIGFFAQSLKWAAVPIQVVSAPDVA